MGSQLNDYLTELLDAKFDRMLEGSGSWSEASLLDIASYKNGLAMQKFRPKPGDSGLPVLKIRELGQGCCGADAERCQSDIDEGVMVHDGDLIFSWSGTLLLDFWAGGDAGLNQHLFKVTSESYPSWFYYMWTKHHLHKFIAMAKDRATTMGHIKRSALADSRVLIPEQGTLAELTNSMQPIVNQVITNKVECRKLSELRDALLPKLMSGEIDASKVDITQLNNHLARCVAISEIENWSIEEAFRAFIFIHFRMLVQESLNAGIQALNELAQIEINLPEYLAIGRFFEIADMVAISSALENPELNNVVSCFSSFYMRSIAPLMQIDTAKLIAITTRKVISSRSRLNSSGRAKRRSCFTCVARRSFIRVKRGNILIEPFLISRAHLIIWIKTFAAYIRNSQRK